MSLITLAGLGITGVSALSGAIGTPTLTTVALSTAGPLVVRWALTRYIKNSLGNYYYVYELVTGTTPDDRARGSLGLVGGAAAGATALATGVASLGISMLVVTACGTGKIAYKVVRAGLSGAGAVVSGGIGLSKAALDAAGVTTPASAADGLSGDDGVLLLSLREAAQWNTVHVEPELKVFARLRATCRTARELENALAMYRSWYLLETDVPAEALEEDWQVVGDDYLTGEAVACAAAGVQEPSECPGSAEDVPAAMSNSLYDLAPVTREALEAQEQLHSSRTLVFECAPGEEIVEDCEVSLTDSVTGSMSLGQPAAQQRLAASADVAAPPDLVASAALAPSALLAVSDDEDE